MSISSRRNYNLRSAAPAKLTLLTPSPKKTGGTQDRYRRKSALDQQAGGLARRNRNTQPKPTTIRRDRKAKSSSADHSKRSSSIKLPNPKSATFIQDSLNSIGSIRDFCRQCLQYVQQADTVLDQLQGTAKSLQEAGVLQKLTKGKTKDLGTNDLTTMLFALMNSPIGASFFRRLGSGSSDQTAEVTPNTETK